MNSAIGACSCPVGMSGASYKNQGAVSMKFHISIFNFIPSTTPSDRVIYAYIALGKLKETILISTLSKKKIILLIPSLFFLGYVAEDFSFYASLRAEPATPQDR